jgi:hypothetical protein
VTDARLALATCSSYPTLPADDRLLVAPLAALGVRAEPVVWNDPVVDWAVYDLVVVRSTWDYVENYADYLSWAASVPRLANPGDVLAWNTDKGYLRDLAAAGVPVVDTTWVGSADVDALAFPEAGRFVVKPSVSASARDTRWYDASAAGARATAEAHVRRIVGSGRTAMIQPYLEAVDVDGETALLFAGGRFSHAVRRSAVLVGADGGAGGDSVGAVGAVTPRPADVAVAAAALAAVPGGQDRLLYARIDLVDGRDGQPRVLEVELTEPSLFLGYDFDAPDRFARAIAAHLKAAPTR